MARPSQSVQGGIRDLKKGFNARVPYQVLSYLSQKTLIPIPNGAFHAREENNRTRSPRQARRQIGIHTSRRICAGRNQSYSRRQTWRSLDQAGHCDRIVQSQARGSKTARAAQGPRFQRDPAQSQTRSQAGSKMIRTRHPSPKRSRAILKALRREGYAAASHSALARQTRSVAHRKTSKERSAAARKAARTRAQT